MRGGIEHLQWMSRELRDGEWAIWGALANRRLWGPPRSSDPLVEAVDAVEKQGEAASSSTYEWLLRRCAANRALGQGRRLHSALARHQRDGETLLGNLLVHMYGVCGSLEEAEAAFHRIRRPNKFSWNIVISALARHGLVGEARALLRRLPQPDTVAWNALLAAYARSRQLVAAASIFESMPCKSPASWNTMLSLYADMGRLAQANAAFDAMTERDVISWNAMVRAYAGAGHLDSARRLFDRMPKTDGFSWSAIMRAYATDGQLGEAAALLSAMPSRSLVCWNVVMQGFAEAGDLQAACSLFHAMPQHDVCAWNAMVTGYSRHARLAEARRCFDSAPEKDTVSWNCLLSAYTTNGMLNQARHLFHDEMLVRNLVSWNVMVSGGAGVEEAEATLERMPQWDAISWNTLLAVYAKEGRMDEAAATLDRMPEPNASSWNTMVTGYLQAGQLEEAKLLFDNRVPSKDRVLWTLLLVAHADRLPTVEPARAMLDRMPHHDVVCCNAMIRAYADRGLAVAAAEVFHEMPVKNLWSWTGLVSAYAQADDVATSKRLFEAMPERDIVAWGVLFHAYVVGGSEFEQAVGLFGKMPQRDLVSWNALLDLYMDAGLVAEAKKVFEQGMPDRDRSSWKCLLKGLARCSGGLDHFRLMDLEGVGVDEEAFAWAVEACSNAGLLEQGRLLHRLSLDAEQDDRRMLLDNALVNMYARCGSLGEARAVFDAMASRRRSIVSWNSMISAYAAAARGEEAVRLFWLMEQEGMLPSTVTLLSVLSGCSHSGLIGLACGYVASIARLDYGEDVELCVDHLVCLVDMLARSGRLDEAEELAAAAGWSSLSSSSCPEHRERQAVAWTALLGACRSQGDETKGAKAAGRLLFLDPSCSAPYVLLSSAMQS